MDRADEEAFRRYVDARSVALLRTGYLLVGDVGRAEDLLQTAFVKTYLAWPRLRDTGAVEGYVRRTMITTATSWWRMRWYRERVVDRGPDAPAVDDITGMVERDALCEHLLALPAKQRAVLVLRYYEGMAEAEIAEILGISRGTVKSHTSRALAALRLRLTDEDDRTVVHR